jgi:SAM-dependent methyltransferase
MFRRLAASLRLATPSWMIRRPTRVAAAASCSARLDNVAGHRAKYEYLKANLPREEVGGQFIGGGAALAIGFIELEIIRHFTDLKGAFVVDIGCGIGRLTGHLVHEDIAGYLGIDIIPEILREAIDSVHGDARFSFALGENCRIPREDASCDIVVGFSVITHLLDEEAYEYFVEAERVLKPGGTAVFSFLDFGSPAHADSFFAHAAMHRSGQGDLLKFTTKQALSLFAARAGFCKCVFIDPSESIPASGRSSQLVAADEMPAALNLGQSLCIVTTPS